MDRFWQILNKRRIAITPPKVRSILSNLVVGFTTHPELFANRSVYDRAYGYRGKNMFQRAVVDEFWILISTK